MVLAGIFFLAVVIAFIAAIPVGAVNMAVVQATLNEGKKPAYLIGLGAILVEAVYAAIPLFGLSFLFGEQGEALDFMILISIPILLVLGAFTILNRKAVAIKSMRPQVNWSAGGKILYGFTLCVTNPMIMVFWGQIAGALTSLGVLTKEIPRLLCFFAGVPSGTYLLYVLIIFVVGKRKRNIPIRTRAKINMVVGVIFLVLALYLGWHFLHSKGYF